MPKSGYPLAVLNIEVAKNTIDINVHPQKIELKFADEALGCLKLSIKQYLMLSVPLKVMMQRHLTPLPHPQILSVPAMKSPCCIAYPRPTAKPPELISLMIHETNHSGGLHSEDNIFREADADDFKMAKEQIYAMKNTAVISQNMQNENILADTQTDPQLSAARELFPLGQIDLCYIIAQGEDGMYIIDQHAAHERILYDRFGFCKGSHCFSATLLVHL